MGGLAVGRRAEGGSPLQPAQPSTADLKLWLQAGNSTADCLVTVAHITECCLAQPTSSLPLAVVGGGLLAAAVDWAQQVS